MISWVRALTGSQHLKALIVFDETYGFLPPHPALPPTKRPLVALMKQARAFGVGVLIATQNPMDLDYRALGNAGFWALGRLQTDVDRERVIEGLANEARAGESAEQLADILKQERIVAADDVEAQGGLLDEPRVNRLRYLEGTPKGSTRWIDTGWALAAWGLGKPRLLVR